MTGHKPWPPKRREKFDLAREQYFDKFESMDRQAMYLRRRRRIKDGLWALAAVAGFVAMLMVGGCSSTPTHTPWCAHVERETRIDCEVKYGPRRIGNAWGYTLGYEEYCMTVAHAAQQRCER